MKPPWPHIKWVRGKPHGSLQTVSYSHSRFLYPFLAEQKGNQMTAWSLIFIWKINLKECTAKRTNIHLLSQYFEMTVEDIFVDCSPSSVLIPSFHSVNGELKWEVAEMSGLCDCDSAQTLQKETCTRTVGRAKPRAQCAAAAQSPAER